MVRVESISNFTDSLPNIMYNNMRILVCTTLNILHRIQLGAHVPSGFSAVYNNSNGIPPVLFRTHSTTLARRNAVTV
jgi:hypothetical protein